MNAGTDATTLLDSVCTAIRACGASPDGVAQPAAILWPDPAQQWLLLKPALLRHLPELVALGPYEPGARTGPAIWLRCVVDRALGEGVVPPDRIPVVYLPGVARQSLRAGDDCPSFLRPLVELLYRGSVWLQRGGHEWSVTAFLASPQGLGLDVGRDQATRTALLRALAEVGATPVAQLRGRRLEADDFDQLLAPDPVRDLLQWMSEPTATRERMGPLRWEAFRSQARQRFGVDPAVDGELKAGELLARSDQGPWHEAWKRFAEAPTAYPGMVDLLRRAQPNELLLEPSRWPTINEAKEAEVRAALAELKMLPHAQACTRVLVLEGEHSPRRSWVWHRLQLSPMATLLDPLARLAHTAQSPLGGGTPREIAEGYVQGAWEADAASWEAVALTTAADEDLVREAVHALLGPWLEESARALQRVTDAHSLNRQDTPPAPAAEPGSCLLFTDGLRYDVGRRLAERLERQGYRVQLVHQWAALPTVTATAKPAVTPVASEVIGEKLPEDFAPMFRGTRKPVAADGLRGALRACGYQLVDEAGDVPGSPEARGWAEAGALDSYGHKLGEELARQVAPEIERLVERISALLDGGWRSVRVVTDHGWLLLPGGLPKVDLPKHLTASRWKRCAVLAGWSEADAMSVPWHWNSAEQFVTARGIACFNESPSYAHGGISVQECLVPDLLVERSDAHTLRASIQAVTWRGMRCFVEARCSGGPVTADLRLEAPAGMSVVAAAKSLNAEGMASLVVRDDAFEAAPLVLVLLDEKGNVLAQKDVRVGVAS